MIKQELLKRNLPPLRSRKEMVEIMQREVYGYLPENDFELSVGSCIVINRKFARGTVFSSSIDLTLTNKNGSHTFPVHQFIHNDGKKHPVIICIDFYKQFPSNYMPIEELTETEYDIFVFCIRMLLLTMAISPPESHRSYFRTADRMIPTAEK